MSDEFIQWHQFRFGSWPAVEGLCFPVSAVLAGGAAFFASGLFRPGLGAGFGEPGPGFLKPGVFFTGGAGIGFWRFILDASFFVEFLFPHFFACGPGFLFQFFLLLAVFFFNGAAAFLVGELVKIVRAFLHVVGFAVFQQEHKGSLKKRSRQLPASVTKNHPLLI
jgi:hypothetical protein